MIDYKNMSPSPYKRLYHRTLLRKWKTLDWAHYILCQRKTEDYLWSEYSASDTSNIVQTGGLTAFTCEPLEAEEECQFGKSHGTKMTNKFSCSSGSSDEQHDPNHASHLLAKTTTFEGSSSSYVLCYNSLHCRNKSLSPFDGICLVLILLVPVSPHKCWQGFRLITIRLHEVFNLRMKEINMVGNEASARNMKFSEAKFVEISLTFILPH